MPKLKFGPVYTRIQDQVSTPQFSGLVEEELGFDSLWATESIVTDEPGLDAMTTLAAFAQHTSRVTLGSCVLLLPLHNPAILAKEAATVDYLSNGRLILGVGAGGEAQKSFDVCGVSLKERAPRTNEHLEVIKKLWTGRPVSHQGRFFHFDHIQMEPAPIQKPHPPLWIGGEAPPVLKRTARFGDGFVPVNVTPADYAQCVSTINRYAAEQGREPSAITRAIHLYFLLGDEQLETHRRATEAITRRYGWPVEFPPERGCAFGTVTHCIATIEKFAAAGVEHFVLNAACGHDEVVPQIRRFASEIMSYFR